MQPWFDIEEARMRRRELIAAAQRDRLARLYAGDRPSSVRRRAASMLKMVSRCLVGVAHALEAHDGSGGAPIAS
jgi:hypothetical protein